MSFIKLKRCDEVSPKTENVAQRSHFLLKGRVLDKKVNILNKIIYNQNWSVILIINLKQIMSVKIKLNKINYSKNKHLNYS